MGKADYGGVQEEKRILSALPIRIEYQSPRYEYFCKRSQSDSSLEDPYFDLPRREGEGNIRPTAHLDPYAVRDAFFKVKDTADALIFLGEAGKFWPFEAVYWSQFREWQTFFEWISLKPDVAFQSPEGKKAWLAADSYGRDFFTETPMPSWVSEMVGPDKAKEMMLSQRKTVSDLARFALRPRVTIEWRDPTDQTFERRVRVPSYKGQRHEPFMSIEVWNVVEAVAATIYADRSHGITKEKCKHCGKPFTVQSGHGAQFCPPSGPASSSTCKNAYMQQQYRDRDAKAYSFLMECSGMESVVIDRLAAERGITITPKAKERAKKNRRRKSKRKN